jgi:hypothetical protein
MANPPSNSPPRPMKTGTQKRAEEKAAEKKPPPDRKLK